VCLRTGARHNDRRPPRRCARELHSAMTDVLGPQLRRGAARTAEGRTRAARPALAPTLEAPFGSRRVDPRGAGFYIDRFHAIAANQGCIRQLESAERFTCGRAEPALSTSIGSQPGSRYVLCHDSERRRHHDNTRLLDLRARAYERTCGPPDGFRVGQERTTTTLPEARPSPT
jgi:hypothetical protein